MDLAGSERAGRTKATGDRPRCLRPSSFIGLRIEVLGLWLGFRVRVCSLGFRGLAV